MRPPLLKQLETVKLFLRQHARAPRQHAGEAETGIRLLIDLRVSVISGTSISLPKIPFANSANRLSSMQLVVVDANWLRQWCNSTSTCIVDGPVLDSIPPLPPVTESHLYTFKNGEKLLESSSAIGKEWMLVPFPVWQAFHCWFGSQDSLLLSLYFSWFHIDGLRVDNSIAFLDQQDELCKLMEWKNWEMCLSTDSPMKIVSLLDSKCEDSLYPLMWLYGVTSTVNRFGLDAEMSASYSGENLFRVAGQLSSSILATTALLSASKTDSGSLPESTLNVPCKKCYVCHRLSTTRCSKCTGIWYCSRQCQELHWKYHKQSCKKISTLTSQRKSEMNLDQWPIIDHQIQVLSGKEGKIGLFNLVSTFGMEAEFAFTDSIPVTISSFTYFIIHHFFRNRVTAAI